VCKKKKNKSEEKIHTAEAKNEINKGIWTNCTEYLSGQEVGTVVT
jgi:hypothetical protein